ncbi:MAG: thymidine phosphorylase [Clostridia bacterium]|nr:thymidine phosphorylase [Clostridia bacterium]
MRIYDIIDKKRHGGELTKGEIDFVISGYMKNEIPDYQISALLMAICINSMSENEVYYLTDSMVNSGECLNLDMLGDLSVDKHSTGGVGDKTTLIVAPIVASLGGKVAKMSGRGLGFTGGTIDKLEAIDGFKTSIDKADFLSQVENIGICVIGQSQSLAPADKKLYALRDVTATVESIPLIASSIMSKKIASGSKSIVLDVKVGSGAFMKTKSDASLLARTMIEIGKRFSRNVRALITNMDVPLGRCVGNALEVWEAIEVLSGRGEENLKNLCISIASNMLSCSLGIGENEATLRVNDAICSGKALSKLKEWVCMQGGDASCIENPSLFLNAKYKKEFKATNSGYITAINAQMVGTACMALGAGRIKKEDSIDKNAGVMLNYNYGDYVSKGDPLCVLYSSSDNLFSEAEGLLYSAFEISEQAPPKKDLILEVLK